MDEFAKTSSSTRNMQTLEDMQNFMEGFSEFSAAQRNAGKHVTLMSELSSAVESRGLMDISSVSCPLSEPEMRSAESAQCRHLGRFTAHLESEWGDQFKVTTPPVDCVMGTV